MTKRTVAVLIVVILILSVAMAAAQQPKEQKGPWQPRDPEKAREHFDMLTMWRMMEAIDLDKSTGEKVFDIRRKFTARKLGIEKDLRQDLDTLRARLQEDAAKVDDKDLERIINGIREKRKSLGALHDQQYDEISKVLNVRKQAQLLIFMKDFQDEIREFMRLPPPPPGPPPFQRELGLMPRPPGGLPHVPPGPPPSGADSLSGQEDF